MGKNKNGSRSNRKNSMKNTFNKYGKYTIRSLRISDAQTKNIKNINYVKHPQTKVYIYTSKQGFGGVPDGQNLIELGKLKEKSMNK